jgi:hypothetical protein
MTTILLIVDAATGGKIKPRTSSTTIYGSWDPDAVSQKTMVSTTPHFVLAKFNR